MNRPQGILLVNLGTPDAAESEAVGKYLREFLMDPLVIDIPSALRWFLVNILIVPKRKHASAELYRNIWTERGSPLLYHTQDLGKALGQELKAGEFVVEIAMRYGSPSIESGLARLKEKCGTEKPVVVVPLYPQYAESSYLSTQVKVEEVVKVLGMSAQFVPPFYSDESYLDLNAEMIREFLAGWKADHVFFTFHGLPVKHILKTDRSNEGHCLKTETCCAKMGEANRHCYRAQSYHTAREIAKRAGLTGPSVDLSVNWSVNWSVGFQSRLGRQEWIKPYTDDLLPELARKGVKRVAVASPSFVADCLETLEEIGFRERDRFLEAGGEELRLIPSLNSDPRWVRVLKQLLP